MAFSAVTLLETAILVSAEKLVLNVPLDEFFHDLDSSPIFQLMPITSAIAFEAGSLGVLRDPTDRAIVATARVHHLRLVTSDGRIIESKLIPIIE